MNQPATAQDNVDEFLADVLPRQEEEERAVRNGDPEPRLRMWSSNDPVTLFGAAGAAGTGSGWERVSGMFRWIASRFSDCREYEFELLAAEVSGDLAYTVGFERSTMSIDGDPARPNVVRVTHVYRREDGQWKIVHRHGTLAETSAPQADSSAAGQPVPRRQQ
jgi:ketosteroid isomerase-like protein